LGYPNSFTARPRDGSDQHSEANKHTTHKQLCHRTEKELLAAPQQPAEPVAGVDEHGQSKQLSFDQHFPITKNTAVLPQHHKHTRISSSKTME
jgi:hypothetical protein